ncbi:MAG: hypothetical protein LQ340_006704 [Diploschistes diacapsis]|nr:MAG: hypothetical protein LQ340_006704 [Diploschistes diacapsis]
MASNSSTQTPIIQSKRTSFGQGSSANVSLLFEKTKANIRRSTPDSEALASSDDEQEQHHRLAQLASQQAQQPLRRTSWLSENHGSGHRKLSLSGSGSDSFSPPNSRGTSSNTDAGTWATSAAAAGRISAANSAFPWGNTIWNDAQKGPPARLAEVLPSSISRRPSSLTEDSLCSPSIRHDSVPEAAIPFAIPLHPTLKSYRSQSYSVGQLDQEPASGSSRQGQAGHSGRTRAGSSYAGLQHRLSRPSMLGDFSPDTSILEQLREVDDDDEISTTSSEAGARLPGTNARTMEQLAMENAILHQQAYANRASANGVVMTGVPYPAHSASLGRLNGPQAHFSESVLEEPDGSSTGANEGITGHNQNLYVRSISNTDEEVFDAHRSSSVMYAENRALQNVKKGHWQTSLGFGGMAEVPQSRRHSFAEVPLRNATVGIRAENPNKGLKESQERAYGEGLARPGHGDNSESSNFLLNPIGAVPLIRIQNSQVLCLAASYFSNPLTRPSDTYRPSSSSSSIQPGYNGSQHSHMTTVTRPSSQPSQQLYVVTFKAARAEFYYVQEGTGLEVNAGDLVIVEADRGTDLGTVAHKNIDWASAKHLKERYVTEHFNCLMMFSRQSQGGQLMASNSPTAGIASTRSFSGNVAGVGLPTQGFPPDTAGIEIKPKMIKRLAQPHEIHMLRDKEGNEAKAKRMCQQKVAEHHLNMEILDAEFQM